MSAAPPSTADYLRFHALHQPRAIALISGGLEVDYAAFHRDLGKLTRALRGLGLPRGSTVAVATGGFYVHWLLLLACENLGWATASFPAGEGDSLKPLLAHVQLVLAEKAPSQAAGIRWQPVTRDWVRGILSTQEAGDTDGAGIAPVGLDEVHRIRRSSGTTGAHKMMRTTRRIEEHRIEKNLQYMGFTPGSRLLVSTHFTVASVYARATACLRLGATCIGAEVDLARALVTYRPTHAWLFQFQMKAVLDALPEDFGRNSGLSLMMGSAPVSQRLWERLRERLASRISYTYNSNEAGTLASVSQDGVCTLRPGVELEVVDERGAAVSPGQSGEIKVRTVSMIEGYLDDPELTAQKFRDGWFLTGDRGVLLGPRQFRLEGRTDEMINIGGRKYSADALQALVEAKVDVVDLGLTPILAADGLEELGIAVVLRDRAKLHETVKAIAMSLPDDIGRRHVRVVDEIPRTAETGKIRRGELKKLFALP